MEWTLEKIMLNLSEALLNLKDDYPNRDKAQRAFGALMNHTGYTPHKTIIVLHGFLEQDGEIVTSGKEPIWSELVVKEE